MYIVEVFIAEVACHVKLFLFSARSLKYAYKCISRHGHAVKLCAATPRWKIGKDRETLETSEEGRRNPETQYRRNEGGWSQFSFFEKLSALASNHSPLLVTLLCVSFGRISQRLPTRCVFFFPTDNTCSTVTGDNRTEIVRVLVARDPCQMRTDCIQLETCFYICLFASHTGREDVCRSFLAIFHTLTMFF